MTRKRLGAIDQDNISQIRGAAEKAARERRGVLAAQSPPIAKVAGSAARNIGDEVLKLRKDNQTLQKAADSWEQAQSEGLIIELIALDDVDTHALSRDRRVLDRDGDAWAELKASLQARGQQVPVEVGEPDSMTGKRRLISGLR